jgi:hypothetical protein
LGAGLLELGWCTLSEAYVLAVMSVAGYSDALKREVEPLLWLASSKLGLSLGALCMAGHVAQLGLPLFAAVYALSFAPAAVVYVLYRLGYMGGADFLALAFMAATLPLIEGTVVPAPMLAVIYSVAPTLAHRVLVGVMVCGWSRASCLVSLRVSVEAREIVYSRRSLWWIVVDERLGGRMLLEPHEAAVRVVGRRLDERVEATPGMPYVAHLAVGLALALALGDGPVIALLSRLAGY